VSEDTRDWNELAEGAGPRTEADPNEPEDVARMSFEQALAELETIVQELERGQLDLEAAIQAYERGTRLKEHCSRKLKEAQLRVERISLGEDGVARAGPMDLT